MAKHKTVGLILAGGSGDRFWPISHSSVPKQFLNLINQDRTLLSDTVNRIRPIIPSENCFIGVAGHLVDLIEESDLTPTNHIFSEPLKRNTLGGIIWGIAQLLANHQCTGEESLVILTSDHFVGDEAEFRATILRASEAARQKDEIILIGIRPTRPETGFGYIEIEPSRDKAAVHKVCSFTEKPKLETAEKYLKSDRYLWNTGMIVSKISSLTHALSKHLPNEYRILQKLILALKNNQMDHLERIFSDLPDESIDAIFLEKTDNLSVIAANFPWDDVGTWTALDRVQPKNTSGNIVKGECIVIDSENCVIQNRLNNIEVAVIGMKDVVVVASDNGILVCRKEHAQRVKEVPQAIRVRDSSG